MICCSLTELQYLTANEDYLRDFTLSQPHVVQQEALLDQSMEETKKLAEQFLSNQNELNDFQQSNQELQYEYDSKVDELKELAQRYKEKSEKVSKANMEKMMKDHAAQLNKESQQVLRKFKKGEIGVD